jgi:hypothetical protein
MRFCFSLGGARTDNRGVPAVASVTGGGGNSGAGIFARSNSGAKRDGEFHYDEKFGREAVRSE